MRVNLPTVHIRTTSLQMLRCDAIHDGKCEGEIKKYGNRHFNCLLAGEYHNFCNYHYCTAIYCPAHPCFNKITRTWDITINMYLPTVFIRCNYKMFIQQIFSCNTWTIQCNEISFGRVVLQFVHSGNSKAYISRSVTTTELIGTVLAKTRNNRMVM